MHLRIDQCSHLERTPPPPHWSFSPWIMCIPILSESFALKCRFFGLSLTWIGKEKWKFQCWALCMKYESQNLYSLYNLPARERIQKLLLEPGFSEGNYWAIWILYGRFHSSTLLQLWHTFPRMEYQDIFHRLGNTLSQTFYKLHWTLSNVMFKEWNTTESPKVTIIRLNSFLFSTLWIEAQDLTVREGCIEFLMPWWTPEVLPVYVLWRRKWGPIAPKFIVVICRNEILVSFLSDWQCSMSYASRRRHLRQSARQQSTWWCTYVPKDLGKQTTRATAYFLVACF